MSHLFCDDGHKALRRMQKFQLDFISEFLFALATARCCHAFTRRFDLSKKYADKESRAYPVVYQPKIMA